MPESIVNSQKSLDECIGDLTEAWEHDKWLRVRWTNGKRRTPDQNSISHCWYEQIAKELGDQTEEEVKCECKLRFGIPILRADDTDFREMYDSGIKGLTYEQKLKAMRFIPVTSLMSRSQLSAYLEHVQMEFAGRGIVLEFPDNDGG